MDLGLALSEHLEGETCKKSCISLKLQIFITYCFPFACPPMNSDENSHISSMPQSGKRWASAPSKTSGLPGTEVPVIEGDYGSAVMNIY